jgi:hypothetical protein
MSAHFTARPELVEEWNDWKDLFLFYFDSNFEITTTVHKQAEWREKLAAAR